MTLEDQITILDSLAYGFVIFVVLAILVALTVAIIGDVLGSKW